MTDLELSIAATAGILLQIQSDGMLRTKANTLQGARVCKQDDTQYKVQYDISSTHRGAGTVYY